MSADQAPNLVVDSSKPKPERVREISVIGHSQLFYWWPVWVLGYLMAIITAIPTLGQEVAIPLYENGERAGEMVMRFPANQSLGVIYCIVFVLVLVMTNVTLRGLASGIVIISLLFIAVLFAYMDWWDDILEALGHLSLFMNLGFYVFFSTVIFIAWALAFFVFDRMEYWKFHPGQAVHVKVFGGGEHAYDTIGMSVYKLRDDLFRHWILGMGSGDIHIATSGASHKEFILYNVLFAGNKMDRIQEAIAMKPGEAADMVTAGQPS